MSDAHPIDAVEAHVTSAIRAAMDVCGNEYWLRWAKAWLNGKRRDIKAVDAVKRHINEDISRSWSEGQWAAQGATFAAESLADAAQQADRCHADCRTILAKCQAIQEKIQPMRDFGCISDNETPEL